MSGRTPGSVTAVVVNHNAGSRLEQCVASLRDAGVTEIVVVDNASTDGSFAHLVDIDRKVVAVPTGKNLGYGSAANIGVGKTSSEFVLVCNPDLLVERDAVADLEDALSSHGDVAIVGPLIVEQDGTVYPSARAFPRFGDAIGHAFVGMFQPDNRWTNRYRVASKKEEGARFADWVSGACILVRSVAFASVGGFDEGYFMYVEDLDLCWRLARAGWRTLYLPQARVTHEGGVSSKDYPYRLLVAHHVSTWRFTRRSASGTTRLLLPVIGCGIAARLGIAVGRQVLLGLRGRNRLTSAVG